MEVYGQDFQVCPVSAYPGKARCFSSLREAREEYEEFCEHCDRYGQEPLALWLYVGTPDGDEDLYGYPDYPDYIIVRGSRGGVSINRT